MPPVSIAYTLATGAVAPTRATPGAAGMDLHAYVPHGGPITVPPGQRAHIPTGVSVALPPGYEGQVRPRSGLAWKRGVTVLNAPGTIDSDYRGELAVILVNHGTNDVTIEHGDRIAQLVVCPVADVALCPADALPATERGSGGFGSTGTGTGPHLSDAWKHDSGATVTAPATVPVALTRRSPDAARAYHEGYAAGLRSMAGWLRDKADSSEAMAATLGAVAGLTAVADADRARMEARIRALEAECAEARAERDQWAAELDGERAAVVAALRRASNRGPMGLSLVDLDSIADAIERGEHRAGGAR